MARGPASPRELLADEVPLRQLAERYGTPLYVYSATAIRQRYQQFDEAFADCEHTICYSVKANSNLSILRLLASLGAGFDIVSGGELQRVLQASRKSASQGRLLRSRQVGRGDRPRPALRHSAVQRGKRQRIAVAQRSRHSSPQDGHASPIRVNPDVDARTHPYISTGLHEHKFGVPMREAPELYRQGAASRHLKAGGRQRSHRLADHRRRSLSRGHAARRFAGARPSARRARHSLRRCRRRPGHLLRQKSEREFPCRVKSYASAIVRPLQRLGVHVLLEPGRSIIGPAGALLTRVIYRKQNDGKQFLIVDAAMNDLMRPSLYGAHHEIVPVVLDRRQLRFAKSMSSDRSAKAATSSPAIAKCPTSQEGDLLAILDAGAYGMSLASNYNTRPRAAEVLVDGERAQAHPQARNHCTISWHLSAV